MKKAKFYTLTQKNRKKIARKHEGYTDGTFNYYRGEYGTWFAIEPNTGMSVCSDVLLKIVSARAHNMLETIEGIKDKEYYKNCVKLFQKLTESEDRQ